jgi:high-affinity iron transporter
VALAPALLLGLREGLEAALILGLVFGSLRRSGTVGYARYAWAGAAAAVALSLAAATVMLRLGRRMEGPAEPVFEGVMMLLAAGLLTWMIFWMQRQGRLMLAQLEGEVRRALTTGQRWGLTGLAFVAVAREGLELALFLTAAALSTSEGPTAVGGLAGVALAALLGWTVYASTVRLNLRRFFDLTGALLLVFAAGLVALGVHEFNEVGWIPSLVDPLWNINGLLDESNPLGQVLKAMFGYNSHPSLSEMLAYFGFLITVTALLLRRRARPRPAAPATIIKTA